jgi:hypothetical protein
MLTPEECHAVLYLMRCGDAWSDAERGARSAPESRRDSDGVASDPERGARSAPESRRDSEGVPVARLGSAFLVHRTPVVGGPGAVAVNGDGILVLQPGQTLSYFGPLNSAFSVCGPAAVPLAPYRQAYLDAGDNRSMIAINRHASGKPLQIHRHILVLPSGEFLNFEAGGYDLLLTSDEQRPEAADHLPHLLRLLPKVERFSKVEPYTDKELKGFLAEKGVGMSCYV